MALAALAAGCLPVPGYPDPVDDDKATLEPGFDSGPHQLAHWSCPVLAGRTANGAAVVSPGYEIVLLQDPVRGPLLHELNNDWLMANPEKGAGGDAVFSVTIPGTANEFVIPMDHEHVVTHRFRQWIAGVTEMTIDSMTRTCERAAPVRFM